VRFKPEAQAKIVAFCERYGVNYNQAVNIAVAGLSDAAMETIHSHAYELGFQEGGLEELLTDVGLSQGEAHVLALLADGAAHTVGELQHDLGHRPSTLSGILDRLGSRGLIRRALNDADRRSFLISLTRPGRSAARTVIDVLQAIELSALEHVAPRDIAGFHVVARALVDRSTPARPPSST
jgi:DNA-binding MarR family transcriptional regulator